MNRRLCVACVVLLALFAAGPAVAALCGDDVGGQDVPCACGDVVVSDLAITDDPVASTPCPHNGLVVRALGATGGITIDLRGATLAGQGNGTGLWIQHGGPGGARVISTGGAATVVGFRDGVVGLGSVALIDGVRVLHSRRDGLRLKGDAYEVQDVEVEAAGRDGFFLRGRDFRVLGTAARESGRFGYLVQGQGADLGAPVAQGAGASGIHLMGMGHRLVGCTAVGSATGIHLHAMQASVEGCQASANAGDGLEGLGGDLELSENTATNNGGAGIAVRGVQIVDGGGNAATGNGGAQCELAGETCGP